MRVENRSYNQLPAATDSRANRGDCDMKRDYIKEILSKKDRQKFILGYHSPDLSILEKSLKQQLKLLNESWNDCNLELMKHFPIAIVAHMESLFREFVKELIDFGYPYSKNAENLKAEIKFDFKIVTEIQGKTITIGDLISHLLPLSKLEYINHTMTTLIGEDFLNRLKSVVDSWPDDKSQTYEPIIKDASKVYQDVEKTFELRHIYCHEFTSNDLVEPEIIKRCFDNTRLFLEATSCLIRHLIAPNAPKTQAAMNQLAIDEFNQAEAEMNKIYEQVLNVLSIGRKWQLEEVQNQWVDFRQKQVSFLAKNFQGGSIFPLIYYSEMNSLTNQRINELKKILEIEQQYV